MLSVAFGKQIPNAPRAPMTHVIKVGPKSGTPDQRILVNVPHNVAVYDGDDVVLTCSAATQEDGSAYRVIWYEFITNPAGNPISDGGVVLPGHPNAARYSIESPTPDDFNLHISSVVPADGGTYYCQDFNSAEPNLYRFGAQLIVILVQPNCTNSIPANGVVLEGSYQSVECIVYYSGGISPVMTFSGPPPFRSASINTTTHIWSGIDFVVDRTMDTGSYKCTTGFNGNFLPVAGDMSDVIPSWTHLFQTQQVFVYWGPKSMYIEGEKPFYEIGDYLTCQADAFPLPFYSWQRLDTLETFSTQTIQITADMEGQNIRFRCNAQNIIQGFVYSNNTFTNATIPMRTTTPIPTAPPTTTTPPAVSDCFDLTGHWHSMDIEASLCLRIDRLNNGLTYGMIKNGTDTYFVEMYGRTDDREAQVGLTGVWPARLKFGVASFVGECHRCFGNEVLIINAVARYYGGDCDSVGAVEYSQEYSFMRQSFDFDCMS
jgi:hypothetical protein